MFVTGNRCLHTRLSENQSESQNKSTPHVQRPQLV